jgi:isoquinoline 1-oxidoreductase beta subunit
MTDVNRREFVKLSVLSSLGLLIGIPHEVHAQNGKTATSLHPLIRVGRDGNITLFAQNPEMGQGTKTSLPMIIAEELDVDWAGITVEQSDWDKRLENQFSGGSLSVRLNFTALRQAGASARQMLLQAAANHWQVSVTELSAVAGFVRHDSSGRKLGYGELAEAAAMLPVPDSPPLKINADFKLIGKSTRDVDLEQILVGRQPYSLDLKMPNMLYAVVNRCPDSDGQPVSFNSDAASQVEGVVGFKMLRNDQHGGRVVLENSPNFVSGVAVLAENTWAAMTAARLLKVEWTRPEAAADSSALMTQFHEAMGKPAGTIRNDGDAQQAAIDAAAKIDVTYQLPYLAHVTMEPMNCTADASGDQIIVWAPTQNPGLLAETVAAVLGVEQDSITVHVMRSGGGFGRRFYADFVVDAVLLSRHAKRPVKVVWTREDDIKHDYFRSAGLHRVRGGTDEDGRIISWQQKLVSYPRDTFLEREGPPSELGNYEFPAGFVPNLLYEYQDVPARIPLGQWRAVDHSSNVFVVASALDELAHEAGVDTVAFLLKLVGDEQFVQVREDFRFDASRLSRVIKRAAKEADWGSPLPAGRGRGIAASYNQGAWIAEVCEVTVRDGALKIDRIVAAVDCGLIINPKGAEAQIQGGIIEGISAALMGEITVSNGEVQQSNFHDYPICRMHQVPTIEVHFINSTDDPRGLGEPPLPPVAPAICNAIFAATGQRIRQLPLKNTFSV